jgi:uncharacterized protein (DUF2236 family)
VTNMHARVAGKTPSGEAYKALDPELLDWVSATAGYGFLTAYDRFVSSVSERDKARYYREGESVARLYGVQRVLTSDADFMAMTQALAHRFEPHAIVGEFLDIITSGKGAPGAPKFLHRALARGAVSILPAAVAEKLALGPEFRLRPMDKAVLRTLGQLAERIPIRNSPPCQASIRLGLPWNFLYLSPNAQRRALEKKVMVGSPQMA